MFNFEKVNHHFQYLTFYIEHFFINNFLYYRDSKGYSPLTTSIVYIQHLILCPRPLFEFAEMCMKLEGRVQLGPGQECMNNVVCQSRCTKGNGVCDNGRCWCIISSSSDKNVASPHIAN